MIDDDVPPIDHEWIARMRAAGHDVIPATRYFTKEDLDWTYPPFPERPSLYRRVATKVRHLLQGAHRSLRRHAPLP